MSKNVLAAGRWKKQAITDKVDMSLDDIIRLNRKEQQSRKKQLPGKRRQPVKNGRFPQRNPRYGTPGDGAAGPKGGGVLRGGVSKLKSKRILPQMARRRGQGVITGLASRRPTSFQRGFNPTNRAAYTQRMVPKTGLMTGLITGLTTGPTTGPRRGPTTGPRRGPTTGPRRGPTGLEGRRLGRRQGR
ncbi:hypothetical protein NHX12_003638 [Muraenolepis orangiensis]|uniref:UAP56-interacting factor n=1 Tax=Muraenolepis orangiensis TaxID=630683 RepID=A0A9Q0DVA6_9TELE|nr:hypothetical protein NHX12_003638 [Muraenolepis orangiensis]